ncbi:MAG: hypothetical protein WAU91_18440, partial [Desulfatitalea sp.]
QGGELTTNLKLRRDFVLQKHAVAIEEIYSRRESGKLKVAALCRLDGGRSFSFYKMRRIL